MTAVAARHVTSERPFPGLRPFDVSDSEFFFGREKQIASLYRLLDLSRFISVVGSSGSGKSSLVLAGLLPLLQKERSQKGGRPWHFATMQPGDAPLTALRDAILTLGAEVEDSSDRVNDAIRRERIELALSGSSFGLRDALNEIPAVSDKAILLVVDQFEEIFRFGGARLTPDQAASAMRNEAVSFVQLLLEATRGANLQPSVHVLITMRSDFIGDCALFQGLPEVVSAAQFLVPSLSRPQREDVIREPIAKAGASVEPGLVERLLSDTGSESDQLPVLQHCLARLWDKSGSSHALDLNLYEQVGELRNALSWHADEVMASLPGLDNVVENVFRALSDRDREGRETRRALPFGQLVDETGCDRQDVAAVVDRFRSSDCSFLLPSKASEPALTDRTRIDVVHEALLRRWSRISDPEDGWLTREERDARRYRALLTWLEAG